jgi:hypothetical protein
MAKSTAIQPAALRAQIAEVIADNVKSYNVPAFCVRVGIQVAEDENDKHEAHNSKRIYVTSRATSLSVAALVGVAERVHEEYPNDELEDFLSAAKYEKKKVSELVRRDVLKLLNPLEYLFGDRPLFEVLELIFGSLLSSQGDGPSALKQLIERHYLRNPEDMSNEAMLIECGAIACSQARFFTLLEEILQPASRRDDTQRELAHLLAAGLSRSGYTIAVTSSDSGYPVYSVTDISSSVAGEMKNLIFASIGQKPELVFRDAINNDVEIVKNADSVLIYDQILPPSGALLWKHLREWWGQKNTLEPELAKIQLYQRLSAAVRLARSPGEYAIFKTFYSRYPALLGEDKVPALIPQVYLHYDPYTQRHRGDEKFLARQRMDFLLMLEKGVRIVIEVDGRHHYAHADSGHPEMMIADSGRYAEMAAEDRRLRLSGYEIYRFGGGEFADVDISTWEVGPDSRQLVESFFDKLLRKHSVYLS